MAKFHIFDKEINLIKYWTFHLRMSIGMMALLCQLPIHCQAGKVTPTNHGYNTLIKCSVLKGDICPGYVSLKRRHLKGIYRNPKQYFISKRETCCHLICESKSSETGEQTERIEIMHAVCVRPMSSTLFRFFFYFHQCIVFVWRHIFSHRFQWQGIASRSFQFCTQVLRRQN